MDRVWVLVAALMVVVGCKPTTFVADDGKAGSCAEAGSRTRQQTQLDHMRATGRLASAKIAAKGARDLLPLQRELAAVSSGRERKDAVEGVLEQERRVAAADAEVKAAEREASHLKGLLDHCEFKDH